MFTSVSNPRWAIDRKTIILDVVLTGDTRTLPFIASSDDCESHGRMLHSLALSGQFGPIGEPPEPTEDELRAAVLANSTGELNKRLAFVNNEINQARAAIDPEFAAVWRGYITSLIDVKNQTRWPTSVEWPQLPPELAVE